MADVSRIIEIIFGATDEITPEVNNIVQGLGSMGEGINNLNAPFVAITDQLLNFEAANLAVSAAVATAVGVITLEFDNMFRSVAAFADLGPQALATFKQDLLDFASSSSSSWDDITQAATIATKAHVDAAEVTKLLASAENLADAAGSSLADGTAALALNMRAFGIDISQADDFANTFFVALRDAGNTDLPTFANAMQKVAPLAKELGINMDEVAAVFATAGAAGLDVSKSSASLVKILGELITPSKDAATTAATLGVEFNTTALKTQGLVGFLSNLGQGAGGQVAAMEALFGSAKNLSTGLVLAGDGGVALRAELDKIRNSSGDLQAAWELAGKSFDQVTQQLINSAKGAAAQIGLPLTDALLGVENSIIAIFDAIRAAAQGGAFAELTDFIKSQLTEIQALFTNIAANLPQALLGVDFDPLINSFNAIKSALEDIFGSFDVSSTQGVSDLIQTLVNISANLNQFAAGFIETLAPIIKGLIEIGAKTGESNPLIAEWVGHIGAIAKSIEVAGPGVQQLANAASGLFQVVTGGIATFSLFAAAVTAIANPAIGIPLLIAVVGGAGAAVAGFMTDVKQATPEVDNLGTGVGLTGAKLDQFGNTIQSTAAHVVTFSADSKNTTQDIERLKESLGLSDAGFKAFIDGLKESGQQAILASDGIVSMVDAVKTIPPEQKKADDSLKVSSATLEEWGLTSKDANDLAAKGFVLVDGVLKTLPGSMAEVGDAADKELSKVPTQSEKAAQEAAKFALEWEKIQSLERTKEFEVIGNIAVAQIQAQAQQVIAAFESINVTVESTGTLMGQIVETLANVSSSSVASQLIDLLKREEERRQAALDSQNALINAQVAYLQAQANKLNSGESLISITADGLEPELEAFMREIIKRVQLKASEEGQFFLLGIQ